MTEYNQLLLKFKIIRISDLIGCNFAKFNDCATQFPLGDTLGI